MRRIGKMSEILCGHYSRIRLCPQLEVPGLCPQTSGSLWTQEALLNVWSQTCSSHCVHKLLENPETRGYNEVSGNLCPWIHLWSQCPQSCSAYTCGHNTGIRLWSQNCWPSCVHNTWTDHCGYISDHARRVHKHWSNRPFVSTIKILE